MHRPERIIVRRWTAALLLLVSTLLASAGSAFAQAAPHIDATIHARTASPAPGQSTRIAILMVPKIGWHGYWTNPGDSGLPVEARWTTPEGVNIGPLRHPAPTLLELGRLASYVHKGAFTLLADLKLDPELPHGTAIPVRADVSWLACSDTLCVPERASLELTLQAGDGAADRATASLFRAAEAAMPKPGAAGVEVERAGSDWRFTIEGAPTVTPSSARLFPANDGWFAASAPQRFERVGDAWRVTVPASQETAPVSFRGVLADGRRSYALAAQEQAPSGGDAAEGAMQDPDPNPTTTRSAPSLEEGSLSIITAPSTSATTSPGTTGSLWVALGGAVLGGLLLNLMPCVFPILSLKALSLARSGSDRSTARVEGLAYFAGSVATTTALGAILIGARALGHDIGWSFQLQDPRMILLLMLLSLAIALNLAGLYELRGPSLSAGWLARRGAVGALGTGALAALIATPCSGPFMGVALGAALVLPPAAALAVFAGLGAGMALPFLLIAFVPRIQAVLPQPGAWMATFRRVLAVPMLLTVIGLAWVLGRQSGAGGLSLGLLLAATVGLGLWWAGQRQSGGLRATVALAPVAAALLLAVAIDLPRPAAAAADSRAGTEPFSEARFADLRASGVPVFVDFTANWCLVCQVNERVAIDRTETRAAFAEAGVVTLVGDWTRSDPAITRFLESRGRNSIPYYLYATTDGGIRELPQVLSSDLLVEQTRDARDETEEPA